MAQKPTIHYFGIRHHGVGSAKRLVSALNELRPDAVLLEGPADCTDLLHFLSDVDMRPPVSLLAYHYDFPERHIYYPFTHYSPEYQAARWAIEHGASLEMIDIPTDIQLYQEEKSKEDEKKTLRDDLNELGGEDDSDEEANNAEANNEANDASEDIDALDDLETQKQEQEQESERDAMRRDPIGRLAQCAGYQDGESWWNDHIEQNQDTSVALFEQVAEAMHALRDSFTDTQDESAEVHERNDVREAYMRLQIQKHLKALQKAQADADQSPNDDMNENDEDDSNARPLTIAVVCGAWHVPALTAKVAQKDDRALIKALPKKLPAKKIKRTWIPWTTNRLSRRSGYGAGVSAPMWYQHLWDYRGDERWLSFWVGKVARALRAQGHIVSTASVIESVRLSHNLAAIRGRPQAGFEEIIDAVIACLCFGETVMWQQIADELLLGHDVGHIPKNLPLAPLLEDLQRQQKALRLKPETLARELSLDLRSDSGDKRSVLLHRLNLLDVPWGTLTDAGRSRGTFRENWYLQWKADYSVQLVENLVYGNSIEQAANNKVIESLASEQTLDKLAQWVQVALTASLAEATEVGLVRLNRQAAHDTDVMSLLATLPHLVQISRYGTARKMDLSQIQTLIEKVVIQSALALPMSTCHLSPEEGERYRQHLQGAHDAILLAELPENLVQTWWQALTDVAESTHQNGANGLVVGLCNRLLYQGEKLDSDTVEMRLRYALSPAVPLTEATLFFDGFFSEAVAQLHYDKRLLKTVNDWILQLDEEDFMTCLPLFMRTFSSLDKTERQRLLYQLLGHQARESIVYQSHADNPNNVDLMALWEKHVQVLRNY